MKYYETSLSILGRIKYLFAPKIKVSHSTNIAKQAREAGEIPPWPDAPEDA